MDDFNLEKLAKELVVERLANIADAPDGAGQAFASARDTAGA